MPTQDTPPARARNKGRPSLDESAEIDELIRTTALRILLEQGEGATLNAVAQAAGLSRRSVYARYPNKSRLFIDVIRGLMENPGALRFDDSGTADERLYNYLVAALDLIADPFTVHLQRLLISDPIYIENLQPKIVAASRRLLLEPIHRLLEDAVGTGEFAIDDVDAAASVVMDLLLARVMISKSETGPDRPPPDHEGYARFLTNLLTRGFKARPRTR